MRFVKGIFSRSDGLILQFRRMISGKNMRINHIFKERNQMADGKGLSLRVGA